MTTDRQTEEHRDRQTDLLLEGLPKREVPPKNYEMDRKKTYLHGIIGDVCNYCMKGCCHLDIHVSIPGPLPFFIVIVDVDFINVSSSNN